MNVTIDGEEFSDLTDDQQRLASAIVRLQGHLALLDEQRENAVISLRHRESQLSQWLKS